MEQEGVTFVLKPPKIDTRALALEKMEQLKLKRMEQSETSL